MAMTRRAIISAQQQDNDPTLVLIDNASEDCGPYLRSIHDAILFSHREPQGLHYVWNRAFHFLFDVQKCEHVLCINNDVWLRPDMYRLLVEDGGDFVTGISVKHMYETAKADVTSKSPHPDFSCFLMRRKVWDKVGEFDEQMRYYSGDCCYHVRMHRAGIEAKCIALPFYHEGSGTIKSASPEDRQRICKQADADREVFRKKYGCIPLEPQYAELFTESTFGKDAQ